MRPDPAAHRQMRPIGVLVVQGVGGQQRRTPQLKSGEEIYLRLTRWLGGPAVPEPAGGPVEVDTTPKTLGNGVAPEHFEMRRHGSDRAVVVAESRWARDVERPTFGELARWLLGLGPWVVDAYFRKRAVALQAFALSLSDRSSSSPLAGLLFVLYGLYAIAALFVLAFVFALLGLVLGAVLQLVMFGHRS